MFSEQYILFPTSIIRLSPTAEGFISSLSTISQFLLVYERPFTEKLFNSKEHRSDKWVFPECMPIVTVDTDFDASLATIDLLIKSNVLFSDIASSKNIEPISPRQVTGYSIDKRVPRGLEFDGLENLSLNNSFHNATTSVSKQGRTISTINYDPKKSVEQNAKSNGVSVDTIRLYIKRNKIDRTLDDTIYIYNKVWCAYYKDTTIPIVKLAQTIKMPVTTVRKYLYKIKLEDLVPKHGKIGLATIDNDIIKVRKEIAKYEAVGKDYVAKKVGSKYIVSKKEEV